MGLAPLIEAALKVTEFPEVQKLMRRLAKYNVGVCDPRMHGSAIDFDVIPAHVVQLEADCSVT